MKLHTDFTGMCLREYQTEISWRRTMNYAAAVGDRNPFYFDDEREGGVIAPPMFSVAVTWPISERIWEYIPVEDFPMEIFATQVHFTEHISFHRPMQPGDKLTVKGVVDAIAPHKAGTRIVVRYDVFDAQGLPVFTEYLGGLLRGVECCGDSKNAEPIPAVPSAPEQGIGLWEAPIFIDPLAPFVYDGCTNIFFPIHTSVAFARGVGLPGIILQGTATLAYAVREIINREAEGNPLVLRSVGCRFTGMVIPGSEIRVMLSGRRLDDTGIDLFFKVVNSSGAAAISDGYAHLGTDG